MKHTNLSDAEFVQYNGFLTAERAYPLIDRSEHVEDMQSAVANLEEAQTQFPGEDFLDRAIDLADELRKSCRGANRESAERLWAELNDLRDEVCRSAEYGADELKKAIATIQGDY